LADAQHLPHGRHQAGDRHLNFHETRDNLARPVNPTSMAGLLQVADEIRDLVMDADHLDNQSRDYLLELVSHLQKVLGSMRIYGFVDVRRFANELVGAFALPSVMQAEPSRKRRRTSSTARCST